MLDPSILVLLALAGMVAGFVDAIAGGGGLISVPVLLSVGLPPIAALATNKLQSALGTAMAVFTYGQRGLVPLRDLLVPIAATYAGSLLGAFTVKTVDTSLLELAVPVMLIGIACYFALAPRLTDENRTARLDPVLFLPVIGFGIGFYDGILGPGTGSFFTMAFITLFGFGVLRATAGAKVLNLTSNLAALTLFIPAGDVVWPAALAMGLGQIVGGRLGAITGIRWGARIIRPLVIFVSVVLALRLLVFR